MSKRDDSLLIWDIIEASEKIVRYLKGYSEKKFLYSEQVQDAVVRNFGIIGEASSKLSSSIKKKHPEIPWKKLVAFRNRIVHDYIGVDYSVVWNIYKNHLKELILQMHELVKEKNKKK